MDYNLRYTITLIIICFGLQVTGQNEDKNKLLLDLELANQDKYYVFKLDSLNHFKIKFNKNQELEEILFGDGSFVVDTIFYKGGNIRYFFTSKNNPNYKGTIFRLKKNGDFWIGASKDDKEHGLKYFYSGESNKLVRLYNMKNGKLYGIEKEYNNDGNLRFEVFHDESIDAGFLWRKYYYQGTNNISEKSQSVKSNVVNEGYYKNGKLMYIDTVDVSGNKVGSYKIFFENGNLKEQGYYSRGVRQNQLERFFENGKLKMSGSYNLGLKSGVFKCYDESGTLRSEKEYLANYLNGTSKFYDENGKLFRIEEYLKGKRISKKKVK